MGKIFDNMQETTGKLLEKIECTCPKCGYAKLDNRYYNHDLQNDTIECPQCHTRIIVGSRNNDRMMIVMIVTLPTLFMIGFFIGRAIVGA